MSFRNEFEQARDFLILHRSDYKHAYSQFRWPRFDDFNWALDYFDPMAEGNSKIGLWLVDEVGHEKKFSFSEISKRSNQVANFMRARGLQKGDSVFLLIENDVALWEIMLAAMKIGAVIVPNNPLLSQQELTDRLNREKIKMIATTKSHTEKFDVTSSGVISVVVDAEMEGWLFYPEVYKESAEFEVTERTKAIDPLFRYFTSSSSVKPKLVEHSHAGFTVGHLSTMYWMGLHPGDVHLGINSAGWAMHDWNSFIAPWNAEATIFVFKEKRFNASLILDVLDEYPITSFCAPPTVWRLLCQEDLKSYDVHLREALSTGEPLTADLISKVHQAWGLFIRDGYGQTESATLIGVPPEEKDSFGTSGKALPGFKIALLNDKGEETDSGEICVDISDNPWGLMSGLDSSQKYYHTGDSAYLDNMGNFTYCDRIDGLFKSSDYRISPFEIEFVLKEFPAIREAVVIPSPDPIRENVPKALITVSKGVEPSKELALDIMNFARMRLSPFKRIRRVEFMEIPKNTSGEVLRSDLVNLEREKRKRGDKAPYEFWEEDAKIVIPDTWAQELP
ncbi:AMP-binding protein [Bdellovibrio bacteriovorus]|uniref:Acetyl-CoA synthetase n=1 Tax=Bdellovibrio bacteriovorus str. Tiberius TaxID=1069642 RepID=K7YU79_BDEBC|nr:AMP-binding protein [Bdellovibrio bacteriovorus]AFY00200.1 acetyl-CoA synthetase [Bdellovibrio bacteriovorus str. Tiberius]